MNSAALRPLLAVAVAATLAACGSSSKPTAVTTNDLPIRPTTTTTAAPRQPLVLWQASGDGNGTLNGPAFTIPAWASSWTEAWTLRCSDYYGGSLIVTFQGIPENTQQSDFGANQVYNRPGAWHGTNYFYDHGRFAPEVVTATCPWTERIVALP